MTERGPPATDAIGCLMITVGAVALMTGLSWLYDLVKGLLS